MTAVLLDFFGTLVDYDPGRTRQDFSRSHEILTGVGLPLDTGSFVDSWDRLFAELERASEASGIEFSMHDVLREYAIHHMPGRDPSPVADEFVDAYLAEWGRPVQPIPGAGAMLARLVDDGHRLAIVSNTHHAPMVRGFLDRFEMSAHFEHVVTSVGHGHKKPHPEIYRAALDALDVAPADAVFVGDSIGPDYEGPMALGIHAYLVGAAAMYVPAEHALISILDLPTVLSTR